MIVVNLQGLGGLWTPQGFMILIFSLKIIPLNSVTAARKILYPPFSPMIYWNDATANLQILNLRKAYLFQFLCTAWYIKSDSHFVIVYTLRECIWW